MRIGLDIDGVLRDIMTALEVEYHTDFPDHRILPILEWDIEHAYPDMGKAIYKYAFDTKARELFGKAPEYRGASQFVRQLRADGHEIWLITTQSKGKEIHTLDWLAEHEMDYDALVFTKQKSVIDCSAFLDDGSHNLRELQTAGKIVFCMDRTWNQDWDGERVYSFDEFLRKVKQ